MEREIKIISGEVRSGKTSRLQNWLAEHPQADGIVSPVINGKRYVQRIRSGEKRVLDAMGSEEEEALLRVGTHLFLKESFVWAQQELLACTGQADWLVVDEIGPLELRGQGLEPALSKVLRKGSFPLVLVVRKRLVQVVKERYGWL